MSVSDSPAILPVRYAGFWIRAVALSVDWIILCVVLKLAEPAFRHLIAQFSAQYQADISSQFWWGMGASFTLVALYEICFNTSAWQGTPGKRIFNLRIITIEGKRLSLMQSASRFVCKCIINLPAVCALLNFLTHLDQESAKLLVPMYVLSLLLNLCWYLPAAFSDHKTGVHDYLCNTRVIRVFRETARRLKS